jgi:hypothetical protein
LDEYRKPFYEKIVHLNFRFYPKDGLWREPSRGSKTAEELVFDYEFNDDTIEAMIHLAIIQNSF